MVRIGKRMMKQNALHMLHFYMIYSLNRTRHVVLILSLRSLFLSPGDGQISAGVCGALSRAAVCGLHGLLGDLTGGHTSHQGESF